MIDGYVMSIFGQRGTGKSTLMDELIKPLNHVILFDFLGTRKPSADKLGMVHTKSCLQAIDIMKANYGRGVKIWYQPPPDPKGQQEALSVLSHMIWDMQQKQYDKTGDAANITLAVDEMSTSFPVLKLKDGLDGFNLLLTGGRHYGVNIIGASQRPAQVGKEFTSAAEVKFFLQLSEPLDLNVVGLTAGKPTIETVRNLQTLEYVRYQKGSISTGKTHFL